MIRVDDMILDRARQTLTRNGESIHFFKVQTSTPKRRFNLKYRIVECLVLSRKTAQELFDLLYGDDPDGGPDGGLSMIAVRMSQLKASLAGLGLKVHSQKNGGIRRYWIAPIQQ